MAIDTHRLPLTVSFFPVHRATVSLAMLVTVFLNRVTNTMKVFRLKLLKRKTLVAEFCSSLSLIPLLQNASLVTTDSRAPLINAPNENVWL